MNFQPNGFVWLVDRTTHGGDEIVCDGQRIVLKPGEMKLYVPVELVIWLYRTDKKRVWTTDGEFVHRYAAEGEPAAMKRLTDACGPEVGDCSPIVVDAKRAEGWDTTGVPRANTTLTNVDIPAHEMRERLGGGGSRLVHAEKG